MQRRFQKTYRKIEGEMYGWTGQRLKLDLTAGSYEIEKPPVEYYKKWLGGRGFNTDVLSERANALCFAAGPLVGTFAPLSGNTIAGAGGQGWRFGHARLDSAFGATMKYAGYDQIVVEGKADRPLYVFIDDDGIEFRDAGHLWGLGARAATLKILEENVDPDIKVVLIGPAGENRLDSAGIAGAFKVRGGGGTPGLGAVMGGMNLKAIAVKGTNPIPIAHPAQLARASWELHEKIRRCPGLSVKDGGKRDIEKKMRREPRFLFKRISCWACPAACGTAVYITEGNYAGLSCSIVDIEHLAGPEPGLESLDPDISAIIVAACVANDLGMNTGVKKDTGDRVVADIVGGCSSDACLQQWGDCWKDLYSTLFKYVTGIDIGDKEITAAVERILAGENELRAGKGEK